MNTWALVPAKPPALAKTRLAGVLDARERACLVQAMLDDLLRSLARVPSLGGVALVTREPRLAGSGVRCIADPGGGLNEALAHGCRVLTRDGAHRVLLIAGDTPLTTAAEIGLVLDAGSDADVVLVPDAAGRGTNAMLLSPPTALAPAFGPDSFARHARHAGRRGLRTRMLGLAGIGLDIDEPRDLLRLRAHVAHRGAYGFLQVSSGATP